MLALGLNLDMIFKYVTSIAWSCGRNCYVFSKTLPLAPQQPTRLYFPASPAVRQHQMAKFWPINYGGKYAFHL